MPVDSFAGRARAKSGAETDASPGTVCSWDGGRVTLQVGERPRDARGEALPLVVTAPRA